jgi:signal transduction histidine kinase/hemerythrin
METCAWTDNFLTGKTGIDEKRQELVQLINRIGTLIGPDLPVDLHSLLPELGACTESHLIREKTLVQTLEQRIENLRAGHQRLEAECAQLKETVNTSETTRLRLLESERKRSQESKLHMELLLSQIVDGDPVPTLVINAEHKVTHWNRACAAVTGVPAEKMIGTNQQWTAFYPGERPIMADLIVSGELSGLEAHYQGKFKRSLLIDDAYEAEDFFPQFGQNGCWLYFTAAPLRNSKGTIIGAIETLQDVTERHRAEENLRLYQTHLEELVQQRTTQLAHANTQLLQSEKLASIGQLAAGVAHEINNPIGYIHSNIGTLESYLEDLFKVLAAYEAVELGNPERSPVLQTLQKSTDIAFLKEDIPLLMRESREGITRVKKIVQDLKDFSRVDSNQEWQWANLHKNLDSTINIASNEIKYKADIVRDYGNIPDIECLPSQLNQVFLNLLVNAAHAISDDQHGTITIRTGSEQDNVWIDISDTGSGIPPDVLPKIFDPFFTTKPVGKGTGLGLSLSYGIIQNHKGSISVSSQPNQGSTFRISIPIKHPRNADGEPL